MRQLANQAPDATALHGAAQRAAARPEERLPCPACGTSVKGRNLAGHLEKTHRSAPGAPAGAPAPNSTTIVGVDRRIRRWYPVLALAWLAALAAVIVFGPDELADTPGRTPGDFSASTWTTTLGDLARSSFGSILGAGLLLLVVLAVAERVGVFRARLTIDDDGLRLRHRVGTGRVTVPFSRRDGTEDATEVEVGTLVRMAGGTSGTGDGQGSPRSEVAEGAYLRVRRHRRSITVGCAHGTDIRKHWTGWTPGPRSRRWDITVAPSAFVALQYALARTGRLTPR